MTDTVTPMAEHVPDGAFGGAQFQSDTSGFTTARLAQVHCSGYSRPPGVTFVTIVKEKSVWHEFPAHTNYQIFQSPALP